MSTAWICTTCATQYAPSDAPPASCPVCEDDRQYVDWNGQQWTTHDALVAQYALRIGQDDGLLAIAVEGNFAIPQRLLHLRTDAGNILWESLGFVTEGAVAALRAAGGVDRIVISHPHFYSSMVEWSDALGGVEILLRQLPAAGGGMNAFLHDALRGQLPTHSEFWRIARAGVSIPMCRA